MPYSVTTFKEKHLSVSCPTCKAFRGSHCRNLITSEALVSTHRDRAAVLNRLKKSEVKRVVQPVLS